MPSNQRQIIKQAKFRHSPPRKTSEKQTKTIEEQAWKQIDAITNQNERPAILTNKDDYKDIYKNILENLLNKNLMI